MILLLILIVMAVKFNVIRRGTQYLKFLISKENTYTFEMNPNYYPKKEQFEMINGQFDIVMLGNSITEQINWNELLGRNDIANRGISGDITEGMLFRMDSVLKLRPSLCFFMGGVNDITRRIPYEKTLSNIAEIINILTAEGIETVVQSVLYTEDGFFSSEYNNPIITRLNEDLKKLCSEKGVIYMDLNSCMSKNGKLIPEYTLDGLHLNAEGYAVWGKVLEDFLENYTLCNSDAD